MNSNEIHDMIQQTHVEPTRETINRILTILDAMNENIGRAESAAQHANNVAGCFVSPLAGLTGLRTLDLSGTPVSEANGINPD